MNAAPPPAHHVYHPSLMDAHIRRVLAAAFAQLACSCGSSGSASPAPDGGALDSATKSDGSSEASQHDSGTVEDGTSAPPVDGATVETGAPGIDAGAITGLDGTAYYVSASMGSDSNPGTKVSPWQTIQRAGAIVMPGDTVVVMAGTYDGPIFGWDAAPCPAGDTMCVVAGTAMHPILFEADPGATAGAVVIAGRNAQNASGFDLEPGCDYVDIVGFTVTNAGTPKNAAGSITKAGIALSGCQGNEVLNNTVDGVYGIGGILVDTSTNVVVASNTLVHVQGTGTTGHGMYVSGSSVGVQVMGNWIHDNAYVGIHVNGDASEGLPGIAKNLLVAGNVIYKNGQNGINCDGIESSRFENNVIYGNARNGIELYQIDAYGGSTANVIVNNTIDQSANPTGYAIDVAACQYDNQASQPTPPGCATSLADTSTGNIAFDNVLLGGAGPTSDVSNANLALGANITAPSASLFVDASAGDYTLAPGGPGIGSGVAAFGGASAPAAPGGTYDTGAFSFAK